MEKLKWYETIRKRLGMYLGQVSYKGFGDILKFFITDVVKETKSDFVSLTFQNYFEGEIEIKNIQTSLRHDIAIINQEDPHGFFGFSVLNALSRVMEISFDENGDLNQEFNKGVSSSKITS